MINYLEDSGRQISLAKQSCLMMAFHCFLKCSSIMCGAVSMHWSTETHYWHECQRICKHPARYLHLLLQKVYEPGLSCLIPPFKNECDHGQIVWQGGRHPALIENLRPKTMFISIRNLRTGKKTIMWRGLRLSQFLPRFMIFFTCQTILLSRWNNKHAGCRCENLSLLHTSWLG